MIPSDGRVQYYIPSDYPLKPRVVSNPGSEQLELMWGVKSEYPETREKPLFISDIGDPENWFVENDGSLTLTPGESPDYIIDSAGNIREVVKDGWHTGPFPTWDKKKLESERELERLIRESRKNYEFTPPLERP